MIINETNVALSEEDRNWLNLFFQRNIDFMKNNNLIEYRNIKLFADLYEQFLEENNLKENDILMLFLAELRFDQLSYKITSNSQHMKLRRIKFNPLNLGETKLSNTIEKWYKESNTTSSSSEKIYVPFSEMEKINRSINQKVLQNHIRRQESLNTMKDIIVR